MLKRKQLLLGLMISILCAILLVVWFLGKSSEQTGQTSSRVSVLQGETIITLDANTLSQSGIKTTQLITTTQPSVLQTFGVVITPQELADARNNYIAAQTLQQKAQATLTASSKDLARAKALHQQNQNISDKTFQAVMATWQSDEANFNAAQANFQSQENMLYSRWGNVIAGWMIKNDDVFLQLLKQKTAMIQATLPQGMSAIVTDQQAKLQVDSGGLSDLLFISIAPTTDVRLQGISYFYLIPNKPAELMPGTSVRVLLPIGDIKNRWIIPHSAVIWWQGDPWVYLQIKPNQFVRHKIVTNYPVSEGWLVDIHSIATKSIVTVGAQLLLSEELRPATPVQAKGDMD